MEPPLTNPSSSSSSRKLSKTLKLALIVTNTLLTSVGYVGGSLTSRLYFLHGGRRQWLSSFLETAAFPLLLLPLSLSFLFDLHRNNYGHPAPTPLHPRPHIIHLTPRVAAAAAFIGVLTGADDFLYAYGLSFLPVSTSVLILSTHLAFTAFFAFLIVRQRITPFSANAVFLLTAGAAVLGLHASSDRPAGVTGREYALGFALTLGAAALYGVVLPLVELAYRKADTEVTYGLVMEMQTLIGLFASGVCLVGMLVNKDFQAIPREAMRYGLGENIYCVVLVFNAVLWQCFFLGVIGVIFCVDTLLAAIITAVCIPVTEVLGVIFYHENFSSEKGISLVLALMGLASYIYGEYLQSKEKKMKKKKKQAELGDIVLETHIERVQDRQTI